MYHPGCDCEQCSLETQYRTLHDIPLDAGFGVYLGLPLDTGAVDREISFKRERPAEDDSIYGGRE